MKIKRIEHIAVAVENLDFMAKLLGDQFGLDLEYTEERVQTRIGMLPVGETYIELLQGVTPESGATKWLKENGQSLFHICFEVEDIDAARCRADYEDAIYDDLRWLGLSWQEPVRRQSGHFDDYAAALAQLEAQRSKESRYIPDKICYQE